MRRTIQNLANGTQFHITIKSVISKLLSDNSTNQNYTSADSYQNQVELMPSAEDIITHTYDSGRHVIDGYRERNYIGVTPETTPPADGYIIHYESAPDITPRALVRYLAYDTDPTVTLIVHEAALPLYTNIRSAFSYPEDAPRPQPSAQYMWVGWDIIRPETSTTTGNNVTLEDACWLEGEPNITIHCKPLFRQVPTNDSNQNTPTPTYHSDDNDTPTIDPNAGDTPSAIDLGDPTSGLIP